MKTTNFKITIQGLSAHGSAPHSGHDALVAASSTIMNLQAIASRINNPLNPFSFYQLWSLIIYFLIHIKFYKWTTEKIKSCEK